MAVICTRFCCHRLTGNIWFAGGWSPIARQKTLWPGSLCHRGLLNYKVLGYHARLVSQEDQTVGRKFQYKDYNLATSCGNSHSIINEHGHCSSLHSPGSIKNVPVGILQCATRIKPHWTNWSSLLHWKLIFGEISLLGEIWEVSHMYWFLNVCVMVRMWLKINIMTGYKFAAEKLRHWVLVQV